MSGMRWFLIALTLVLGVGLLVGVRAYFNWIINRAARGVVGATTGGTNE